MHISDSICGDCKHFEHECYVPMGEDDYGCNEYCQSKIEEVRERFYDEEVIIECAGFEEEK